MPIWEYDHSRTDKEVVQQAITCVECLFCAEPLEILKAEEDCGENRDSPENWYWYSSMTRVRTCPVCGWWSVHQTSTTAGGSVGTHHESGAAGSLRELDLPNVEGPLEEIRSYLAARYSDRFRVHPRVFEETVASVFRDLGYGARVTAYSGDDGIDVILDGQSDTMIGVQVKRYRNSIQVEQIRSLAGALVLGGLTRGIFVTRVIRSS
jgi:restriction system protein